MKDTLSYAVTADGEETLGACVNRLREWIENLPQTAKVSISIRAKVKDVAEQRAASKTADLFKLGEVKDGVVRKRAARGRAKQAAEPKPAEDGASEGG